MIAKRALPTSPCKAGLSHMAPTPLGNSVIARSAGDEAIQIYCEEGLDRFAIALDDGNLTPPLEHQMQSSCLSGGESTVTSRGPDGGAA